MLSALRLGKRFCQGETAASALEFAMVAPLFFALVFSAFEGGWMMTQRMLLDRALNQTVRLMRVGAAEAPTTQEEMKTVVCEAMLIVPNCVGVITIEMTEVKTASDFPVTDATCVDRTQKVQPIVGFTPGFRSSIMFVRACIVADPFTPGLGLGLAMPKDASGGYNLVATAAFMNEPNS